LNAAVELELWQEAYKSIDDLKNNIFIHPKAVSKQNLQQPARLLHVKRAPNGKITITRG
jgi:hypothetical protein